MNAYRIPVNAPKNVEINNHEQHGQLRTTSTNRDVNYQPSRRLDLNEDPAYRYSSKPLAGMTQQIPFYKEQNFKQAGEFYRNLDKQGRKNLINNLGGALASVPEEEIRVIISAFMYNADKDYGKGVAKLAKAPMSKVRQAAKDLMEEQAARAAKAKKVAESLTALMQ